MADDDDDDDDDDRDEPPSSFSGLGGEACFRARIAKIAAGADTACTWVEELQPVLKQLMNYDAAWLGRWDAASDRYSPLLEDGDVEPLRALFASDVASADIEELGFRRPGWPLLGHRILPLLSQLQGYRQFLAPAGFRDGIGVGLSTSDGRHVGYLTLLTYRQNVVPATASGLLRAVNPLIADAVDRAAVPGRARTG